MTSVFTTTVQGRYIMGDIYEARAKTDSQTQKPVLKDGQPVMQYFFGLAIPKTCADFKAEPQLQAMAAEAIRQYPGGQHQWPSFAWKIEDGDQPNQKGRKYEHAAGCWLLKFQTQIPFKKFAWNGSAWVETNQIRCGDYVQAQLSYASNGNANTNKTPGMYMTPLQVAFSKRGDEIVNTPEADPTAAGFQPGEVLDGAPAAGFTAPVQQPQQAAQVQAPAAAAPQPNPAFLAPPANVPAPTPPAGPQMTAKAGGATWDQFKANGWTEDTARAAGYIV
jgi:hypothetical protein